MRDARLKTAAAALIVVGTLMLSATAVCSAERESDSGAVLYGRFCASCHGVDGRGDGPVAPALRERPPDLTRLRYTPAELMRRIDGRHQVRAHGTAQMPVWGEVFEESAIGEPHPRRATLLRVQALADYVWRLRAPGANEK